MTRGPCRRGAPGRPRCDIDIALQGDPAIRDGGGDALVWNEHIPFERVSYRARDLRVITLGAALDFDSDVIGDVEDARDTVCSLSSSQLLAPAADGSSERHYAGGDGDADFCLVHVRVPLELQRELESWSGREVDRHMLAMRERRAATAIGSPRSRSLRQIALGWVSRLDGSSSRSPGSHHIPQRGCQSSNADDGEQEPERHAEPRQVRETREHE